MKKIAISLLISIIILLSMINNSYSLGYNFTPPYYESDDGKLLIYNTVNAARIKLANGQVVANVEVTGESNIEVEAVYEDTEILLIIDTSGSMSGESIESAKKASRKLINNLMDIPNMKIGLIEFNSDAQVLSNFTKNKSILESKINNLQASGGTKLGEALNKIENKKPDGISFSDSVKLENRGIITLTDGSTIGADEVAQKYHEYELQGYKLYQVLLGYEDISAFSYNHREVGKIFKNISTQDLTDIFNEIYNSIYSELVTVQPPNLDVDTVNAQVLGEELIFFLDNELIQGATLEVEYLINVKTQFDCTSLLIEDLLGEGFIFDENTKLLTDPSQTNKNFSWQLEQGTNLGNNFKLKYMAPTTDGYVSKKGEELNIKLVVSRLLSTTGGEVGGVTDNGEEIFNTDVKMVARGVKENAGVQTYDSDTVDLDGTNIIVTPPWGTDENIRMTRNLVIITLLLITIVFIIIKIRKNK